jgi:hypothetical protein
MTVDVSGGSGAITYQWQSSLNGTSGWANETSLDATTNTFTPSSVNAGTTYYRVLINAADNGCEQAVSDNAMAVISPDLLVTTQPNDVSECIGGTNSMTVLISGGSGATSYQWQSSIDGFTGWGDVTGNGANTPTYTPSSAVAGTTFYRVLINAIDNGCDQAVSNNAIASIIADLEVTTQPSNVNECIGGNNTMTVIVSGGSGDITYQWQFRMNGTSGWADATGFGSNTDTYTPSSDAAGTTYYRLLVNASNSGCDQAVSDVAYAVIAEDLTVTTQPTNINECVGGTNTITVEVSGGSGAITYQWQQSINGSTGWTNSTGPGAMTDTYTPSSAIPGTTYYRVLINAANNGCDQAVSNNSIVIISSDIVITNQPSDVNECVDGTDQMTVVITGGSGTPTYQWQESTDGSNGWTNSTGTGANTATYTPSSSIPGTTYYRVLISTGNPGCDLTISNNAIAVISEDLIVTIQPADVNECVGGADQMTVAVTGGSGTISYLWQSSPNGNSNWVAASGTGSTTPIFTPPSTFPGTTYYRVLVNASGSGCGQAVSNAVAAIIAPDIIVVTQPVDVNECVGGTNTMTIVTSGGSGTITYQWQQSINGSTGWGTATGLGASTTTFTPPSTTPGTIYYRVLINASNSDCQQAVSANAAAIIAADLVVNTQPTDVNECVGGTNTMTVAVSGGSGAITYQWQQSTDGSTGWANSTGIGATTATYTPSSAIPGTTYYRVLVNAANNGCDQAVSNNAIAVITADLVVSTQPTDVNECVGGSNTISVTVTGGSGTITYQWQQSADGIGGWTNSTGLGASTVTYTPESGVAGTTHYRVLINATGNGCGQAVSQNATVIISPDATISVSPVSSVVCIGGSAQLTASLMGGSNNVSIQWQINNSGWSDIAGQTSLTYLPSTAVVGTIQYRVRVIDISSGCSEPFSNIVSVTVQPQPTVTISIDNPLVCVTGTALITSTVLNGTGNLSYQWQSSPNGTNSWINVAVNGNNSTYAPLTNVAGTTYYRVSVSDSGSGCEDPVSAAVQFVVRLQPTVTISIDNPLVCLTGSALITSTVINGSGNINYQWQSSPNGNNSWTNINTDGNATTYAPLTNIVGTTYYRVSITDSGSGCNDPVSLPVELIVQPQPTVSISIDNSLICVGGSSTISSVVSNGSGLFDYQWQSSTSETGPWTDITLNGTSSTYDIPSASSGSFFFRVIITDVISGCDDPASNVVSIIISEDLAVTTQPANIIECIGGTDQMTVVVSGGSGTISYQWQSSPDGSNPWGNVTGGGATTDTYTPPSTTEGSTYYRVLINATGSGCGQAVSAFAYANISPDLSITLQPVGITECIGGTATMSVTVTVEQVV